MSGRVSLSSPQVGQNGGECNGSIQSGELKGIKADGQPSFTDIDEIPSGKLT